MDLTGVQESRHRPTDLSFEKFIQRRISGESDVLELTGGARFLASVLAEREPRRRLIEDYIKDLTGDSLQSAEEIMRTAGDLLESADMVLDTVRSLVEAVGTRL